MEIVIGVSVLDDGGGDIGHGGLQPGFLQLAFPYDDDEPTLRLQLPPGLLIALLVPGHLLNPEVRVSLGNSIVGATFVSVPKAAVNEDDCVILRQYDIRGTREAAMVTWYSSG